MDPLTFLAQALEPPWSILLAGLAVLLFMAPRLMELHASWVDIRLGRRGLDLERRRLELLKLHYEIETLRKEHELPVADLPAFAEARAPVSPGIADALEGFTQIFKPSAAGEGAEGEEAEERRPDSTIVAWLKDHPAIGKPLFGLVQLAFGFLAAMSAVVTIVIPSMALTESAMELSIGFVLFSFVLYASIAWGSLRVFQWARARRKA